MVESAWEYHRRTSYHRREMGGGRLDWGTQPRIFKTYEGLPAVPLPEIAAWPQGSLVTVLEEEAGTTEAIAIDLRRVSEVIRLAHALTAKTRYAGTDFYYRSVASAGALYPFELYLAAINVEGLAPGLYHHNVMQQELTLLRTGNAEPQVAEALGLKYPISFRVAFLMTSIFFRSSWKYRDRAYRYNLLDTAHLAENLFLAIKSRQLPCQFLYDFDDDIANSLLCIDPNREVCLAVAVVAGERRVQTMSLQPLKAPVVELTSQSWVSTREVSYGLLRAAHTLSSRVAEPSAEVCVMSDHLGVTIQRSTNIIAAKDAPEVMSYAEAVFRRRSMRNFVDSGLSASQCYTLLSMLCSESSILDDSDPTRADSIAVGILAGNVEGTIPGFFLLDRQKRSLGLVAEGFVLDDMAHICLGQSWMAKSALHVLFLTNLKVVERMRGPRGYRHAMMAAGRLGQRIYLAATSMRLGCCGIGAFYDSEAVRLLGLNDESALLYLVAVGPVKKWSQAPE